MLMKTLVNEKILWIPQSIGIEGSLVNYFLYAIGTEMKIGAKQKANLLGVIHHLWDHCYATNRNYILPQ